MPKFNRSTSYLVFAAFLVAVFVYLFFEETDSLNDSIRSDEPSYESQSLDTGLSDPHQSTGSTVDDASLESVSAGRASLEPEMQRALEEMTNTSSAGLVEEKTSDGYEVNLQGRFRSVPVAQVNDKGDVEIRDFTSAPVNNENE